MIFEKESLNNICFNDLKRCWLKTSKEFPAFLTPISIEKKRLNEAFLQQHHKKVAQHWGKLGKVKWKWYQKRWMKRTDALLNQVLQEESILNVHSHVDDDKMNQMKVEFNYFLVMARRFDSSLGVSDLGQAIRNYLVYAIFLELMGKPQNFTPAIFGYSLLYPVTDNFIDGSRSLREKQAYNEMIRQKIKGCPVSPSARHEIKTCQLLDFIESEYPRHEESDLYAGLLLMLDAQQESLKQQSKEDNLSMEKRLDISLSKGGISVLINGYLADSSIDDEQLRFFLGFGFVLQLADDLQDISSDLSEGNQTLFTVSQDPQYLEQLLNQLIHFTHELFQSPTLTNGKFLEFLFQDTIFLLLLSAHMSQEHFHPTYLKKLETYFPTQFSSLDPYIKNASLYPGGIDENQLLKGVDFYLENLAPPTLNI